MFPQKQKQAKQQARQHSTRPSDQSKTRLASVTSNPVNSPESTDDPSERPSTSRENTSEFVVLLDATGTIRYISPAANVVLGYTPEMTNGKLAIEFVHPDEGERFAASCQRTLEGSQTYQPPEVYRVRDRQGDWRLIEAILTDLPMALGGGWAIACRPSPPPKVEEETLRGLIFETMHDGAMITDLEGRILDWNRAAERMFGYKKADVLGKTPAILYTPEVAAKLTLQILDTLKCHGRWTGEIGFIRQDGTAGICETAVVPLQDAAGRTILTVGVNRDITDRKRAEEQLREEHNFVEAVLETAGALVVVFDPQGRIVRFNRACERLTQYPLDEVKGKCVWDLFIIPQEIEAVKEVFRELLSSQQAIEYENYWQTKDGSRHLISWSNTVLCDGEGQVKYAIATGLDMTEHQRLEEIRFALQKEKELNQLQSHFFTMAAHQFRTPLSTILLSAYSLEHSIRDGSISQLTKIHRIQLVTKSLTQTIGDILTIERAEAGQLEFAPRPLNFNLFCRQILEKIQLKSGKRHRLILKAQGDLDGIVIDENLMQMTIENLLSNAIEYSPEGSLIELMPIGNIRSVKLQVRDRGLGIPRMELPHIFNAFYRGSNVHKIPGVGLGLTVAKKCVELHGGKILMSSEEGSGTTVTVKLFKH
jgi:PAS domain S-box-containing protein